MFPLPRIMGHRGAAANAPENTLISLRRAAEQGAEWVEFDIMLSGDGVPMLFHDDNLKRITGRDAMMAETPLAELRELEAGAWFGPEFAGEPIPTFEEALALLLDLGLRPNVELKPSPGHDAQTAHAAIEVIRRCWPARRPPPLISSFSRQALEIAAHHAPQLPRGLIARRPPHDWIKVLRLFKCSTIHAGDRWLSQRIVQKIKHAGYGLAAFTVNDPHRARLLLERGVDCLITDAPGAIAEALR